MRVLAIDFGTSNTVAMLRTSDGRMRPLLFDGSPLLPSAVYLNSDGRMLVGRDAERHARLDPSRFEPNPKRCVDDGQIILGDRELAVAHVFSLVLGHVVTEARRQLGGAPDEVRLTHPARWGEQRRSVLVDAARRTGLGNPRLIAEPVGAASYFTAVLGSAVPVGRSLAIYDLGGGTFDATVVRRTQGGFEVLAEEGLADVGGLDFDHAIVEHLGRTYEASHPGLWAQLTSPADANDRRHRRLLYEDVRGAKEMLSRTASADIHLPALEVDAHLTREEFESLVRPYLDSTVECLRRTIDSARLAAADLVGIFLVGGSSRIPLAAHLIHTTLGVAPTTLEQPETVVSEGALCIGAGGPGAGHGGHSGMPRTAAPPRPMAGPVSAPPRPAAGPPVRPVPPARPAVAGPPGHPVPQRSPAGPQPRPGVGPRPPQAPPGGRPGAAAAPAPPMPTGPRPGQSPRPATAHPGASRVPGPPAAPRPQPAPVRPAPQPPQLLRPQPPRTPALRPTPPTSVPPAAGRGAQRHWYSEPTVLATVAVLGLVVLAFVVLLWTAANG